MTNSVELSLLKSGIQNPAAGIVGKAPFGVSRSAIPVILAPNGTVATNGVITLGTALPLTYTAAWVRLPAGAVVGGLAGLYYVVFSSTTVGQVYTAFADPANTFVPFIPATLVAAVGSNAAYTQVTAADVTLINSAIDAGLIGPNGSLTLDILQSNNNSAGAKLVKGKLGAGVFYNSSVTTTVALETRNRITNRGVETAQIVHADPAFGISSAVAPSVLNVNTAAANALTLTGQLATATDYVVIEYFAVEVRAS